MGLFSKKTAKVKDPVCGMEIEEKKAAGKTEHGGKTYHFCSTSCLNKFKATPTQFAKV